MKQQKSFQLPQRCVDRIRENVQQQFVGHAIFRLIFFSLSLSLHFLLTHFVFIGVRCQWAKNEVKAKIRNSSES